MCLSAALDPVSVFAAGIVLPSASLLWRVLCESWCTYQQGCTVTPLGQAWFAGTKETTCWAASGFMPWVLSAGCGNGVESCLVACNSWCWGGTVVRTGKEGGSVCSLKSPFIFLLLHQILLHLCGVRSMQQKPWAQEEWVLGAPSSCAASQPILSSGMAEGRITELNKNPEKFSLPLHGWGVMSTRVQLLQRDSGSFPLYSIYLCLLILFFTCNFQQLVWYRN